jgi:hypothetical protein
VNPGLKMILGNSSEPCGLIQVTSIGSLGPEENKKHIVALTDYVHEATGIPKNKYDYNYNILFKFQCNRNYRFIILKIIYLKLINLIIVFFIFAANLRIFNV